ncbi:MAG TPA: hypothetical protein VD999_01450 [Vitreimonas sp.]|nr:hypothetical protein [Vitreimonas sp.]
MSKVIEQKPIINERFIKHPDLIELLVELAFHTQLRISSKNHLEPGAETELDKEAQEKMSDFQKLLVMAVTAFGNNPQLAYESARVSVRLLMEEWKFNEWYLANYEGANLIRLDRFKERLLTGIAA